MHPVVRRSPLKTRAALSGGPTEALRPHYKMKYGEVTVQYVNVRCTYPYDCKYYQFPVVFHITHVGDVCQIREVMLRKDGLINAVSYLPVESTTLCYVSTVTASCCSACAGRATPSATELTNARSRRLQRGR